MLATGVAIDGVAVGSEDSAESARLGDDGTGAEAA
jgi:hypothetical protein